MSDHIQDQKAALGVWNRFNNVQLHDVTPHEFPGRGLGFAAQRDLSNDEEGPSSDAAPQALVVIPRDLVLSREAVEIHAKEDGHFRELLNAAGHKSTRTDVCLFLLTQRALASVPDGRGVRTPWAEYIGRFLPSSVPVPSTWSAPERQLLQGTTLEEAVRAKITALTEEFEDLQDKTEKLPFWTHLLWEEARVTLDDWFLMDAWYRSRCLELPHSGEAMVPVLDLANHSTRATAYYEEDSHRDRVELLIRPGSRVAAGDEVTISYGEGKSGAEMLYSYGFIENNPDGSADTVTLPLAPMDDDPLGRAKAHLFGRPGTVELGRRTSGSDGAGAAAADAAGADAAAAEVTWGSAFAWLACLNEEDGLDFKVLQDNEGGRQLRLFWQDQDVTERACELEELVRDHPLFEVFALRVVAVVEECVTTQLDRLREESSGQGEISSDSHAQAGHGVRPECATAAKALREQETRVLVAALETLGQQKAQLFKTEVVEAYLGSKEIYPKEQVGDMAANDSDEFS